MKGLTVKDRIKEKLTSLEVEESLDKSQLIREIWGREDYFIRRSFDVHLYHAKKELLPDYEFQSNMNNKIYRDK